MLKREESRDGFRSAAAAAAVERGLRGCSSTGRAFYSRRRDSDAELFTDSMNRLPSSPGWEGFSGSGGGNYRNGLPMQCENECDRDEHSRKGNKDKDFKSLSRKNASYHVWLHCTALTGDTSHKELFKQNPFVLVPSSFQTLKRFLALRCKICIIFSHSKKEIGV